jgi:hypothetical protein
MKLYIPLILSLAISVNSARAQSSYTTIQYKEKMRPALVISLPNSTDNVEATVVEKLKQAGYNPETKGSLFWKKNKKEGFYVFNDVMIPSLGSRKLDMYFKVVTKNDVEKNNSTLYLMVSTGNDYFISPEEDSASWNRSRAFVDGLLLSSASYSLEREIENQETVLIDSRNKLTRLQEDEKQLTEKVKKLQEDIASNQSNQAEQQTDIELQAKALETLKLKRK